METEVTTATWGFMRDKSITHTVKLRLESDTHKHTVLLMTTLPNISISNNNDPYWAKPCLSLALHTITLKVYFDKLSLIRGCGSHSILILSLHGSAL